jgi:hypothetical protein
MYLIKHKVNVVSAQTLEPNDVISIGTPKKWYIVSEKLGLSDKLIIIGLRDGKKYTVNALKAYAQVANFKKVGYVLDRKSVEDLSIPKVEKPKKEVKVESKAEETNA